MTTTRHEHGPEAGTVELVAALFDAVVGLAPLRPGDDFCGGESFSVRCVEMLLNQRIGVERATAATLAVHFHLASSELRGALTQPIESATRWPYAGVQLRPPGRALANMVGAHLRVQPEAVRAPISGLPAAVVGALASLERYHNRESRFFDALRQVDLRPEQLAALDPAAVPALTGQNFQPVALALRLGSAVTLLMLRQAGAVSRADLLRLPFVGDETADTLLVEVFGQPALIVDDYLRRVLYRHHALERTSASRAAVASLFAGRLPLTVDQAHRLHARVNEIGMDHCREGAPDCARCPLRHLPHR